MPLRFPEKARVVSTVKNVKNKGGASRVNGRSPDDAPWPALSRNYHLKKKQLEKARKIDRKTPIRQRKRKSIAPSGGWIAQMLSGEHEAATVVASNEPYYSEGINCR